MKKLMTLSAIIFYSVLAFAQTDAVPNTTNLLTVLPIEVRATATNDTSAPMPFAVVGPLSNSAEAAASNDFSRIDYAKNLVEMPSPNMVGLINQVNASADLFTGKANANLPIYTLKSYDIEVPISVDYSANGVKVDELGSWVGLGWNVNAGGSITRVVNNSPDESNRTVSFLNPNCNRDCGAFSGCRRTSMTVFGYLNLKGQRVASFRNGIDMNNFDVLVDGDKQKIADYSSWFPPQKKSDSDNIGLDTEPDEFYFKFGAYAGKFVFNPDGKILCIPDYKFKIDAPTFQTIDGERQIVAFKITTTEGYVYYFGDTNLQSVERIKHIYCLMTSTSTYPYVEKVGSMV